MKNLSPKFYKIYSLISSLLVVVLSILLIVSVTSGKKAAKPAQATKAGTTLSAGCSDSDTVYVTPSGTRYHRKSCQYITDSAEKLTRAEARHAGYTPCSKCNPE